VICQHRRIRVLAATRLSADTRQWGAARSRKQALVTRPRPRSAGAAACPAFSSRSIRNRVRLSLQDALGRDVAVGPRHIRAGLLDALGPWLGRMGSAVGR